MEPDIAVTKTTARCGVHGQRPTSISCYFIEVKRPSQPMVPLLDELLDLLEDDPWRDSQPFSADLSEVHRTLFDAKAKATARADAIREWLRSEQPCLFGRMAAKEQIQVCTLTERDLYLGEDYLRNLIAEYRLTWKRHGSLGEQHGFIILLV
jgi:hypothetical protein